MILDQLKFWKTYSFPQAIDPALEFLIALTPESEEKEYAIQGEDIWARVMSYETVMLEKTVLESHRKYVDIQMLLSGEEQIEVFDQSSLDIVEAYNKERDVEFYQNKNEPFSQIILQPGLFAVFFPQDAHRPQLRVQQEPELVKKAVVKIRADMF